MICFTFWRNNVFLWCIHTDLCSWCLFIFFTEYYSTICISSNLFITHCYKTFGLLSICVCVCVCVIFSRSALIAFCHIISYTQWEEFFYLTYIVVNLPGSKMYRDFILIGNTEKFPKHYHYFAGFNCSTPSIIFSTVKFSRFSHSLCTKWNLTVVSICLYQ